MKRSREPEEARPEELAPTVRSSIDDDHGGMTQTTGDGDAVPPAAKIVDLDLSDSDSRDIQMRCSLPPHREPRVFPTYDAYEAHYRDQHTNRCVACRKNFPSAHLLGLHIEETHDAFVQAKRERGDRTVSSRYAISLYPVNLTPLRSTHASSKAATENAARRRSGRCT
jgi:hypothetical protein